MVENYLNILNNNLTDTISNIAMDIFFILVSIILVIVSGYMSFKKIKTKIVSKSRKIYKSDTIQVEKNIKRVALFFFCYSIAATCFVFYVLNYHLSLYNNLKSDIENRSFVTVTGYYKDNFWDLDMAWQYSTIVDESGNEIKLNDKDFDTFSADEESLITFVYGGNSKVVVDCYK